VDIAVARLITTGFGTLAFMTLMLVQTPQIHFRDCLDAAWRPAVGAVCMAAVVRWLPISTWTPLAQLLGKATVGAVAYTTVVMSLWLAAGRPDSGESYLLAKLKSAWKRSA
jgi:hypothetical protein